MAFVIDDLIIGALIASTATQVGTSIVARNQQEDAQEARSRIEARQKQRQQMQQIREQQRQVAARQAAAAGTGVLDSSGLEGSVAGIRSSTAGNIGFQNQMFEGGRNIRDQLQSAQDTQFWGGVASSVMSSAATIAGAMGPTGPTGGQPTPANQAIEQGNQTSSIFANQLSRGAGVA